MKVIQQGNITKLPVSLPCSYCESILEIEEEDIYLDTHSPSVDCPLCDHTIDLSFLILGSEVDERIKSRSWVSKRIVRHGDKEWKGVIINEKKKGVYLVAMLGRVFKINKEVIERDFYEDSQKV